MADQQGPPGDAPRPPGSDAPVGFTLDGAQRIVTVTRYVERQIKQQPPQRSRYPLAIMTEPRLAKTGGGGIPAISGTTPGSAAVTFQKFDGTNLSARTETITAFNLSSSAVGANKTVILEWVSGYPFVVWEDCG